MVYSYVCKVRNRPHKQYIHNCGSSNDSREVSMQSFITSLPHDKVMSLTNKMLVPAYKGIESKMITALYSFHHTFMTVYPVSVLLCLLLL